ncbi:MAG: IPTL-CTERM sorting domain-containing protein, partial [Pseudomonadota bacterium]
MYDRSGGGAPEWTTAQQAALDEYANIRYLLGCDFPGGGSFNSATLTFEADGTCPVSGYPTPVPSHVTIQVQSGSQCRLTTGYGLDPIYLRYIALDSSGNCGDPNANMGEPDGYCGVGDPINQGTGNKFHVEIDYVGEGRFPLQFKRYYNSSDFGPSMLATHWHHNYEGFLSPVADASGAIGTVHVKRPDASNIKFVLTGGAWVPQARTSLRLVTVADQAGTTTGWQLHVADNQIESYDLKGALRQVIHPEGQVHSLTYDTLGRVSQVTDAFGRSMQFAYYTPVEATSWKTLKRLTLPDGGQVTFNLDNSVSYPDGGIRRYLYDEAGHVGYTGHSGFLTGIVDESGSRIASFKYDKYMRAYNYTSADGIDAVSITYNGNGTRTIADALGTNRTDTFDTVGSVLRKTGASQPAGAGCSASAANSTYDANGNVASRTDFNGNVTTYAYDLARNLETSRTEASGTPLARTISTQWHDYWRQPVKIAEPKKLITYAYNGDDGAFCAPTDALIGTQPIGVLCSRTDQATTDTTGSQGLTPTVTGSPRTWSYTYDQYGQVLTANGPRTDLNDVATTTYHPANDPSPGRRGNLATVTNALGHVTQVTAYDANGRPLTIIDPNNVTLAFTYTPRGWLATSSLAGQTTTYAYDGVGQLTSLTRPDGSTATYDYDPAHRLTAIADGAGNRVEFTLDALGNVIHTAWLNPDSSVARSHSATFDALGRLQAAIDTRNAVAYTTTYGHDANGNSTIVTDPKTQTTTTQYNALNRPIRITDALSGLTTLAYDARGQVTQFQAPNNAQTSYTVDGLGNVTMEASADRGNLTATHDAAGNLLTLSDARGITETRSYDALDRPLTVSYPVIGENLAYTWDSAPGCTNGIGRLCRTTDNGGSTSFSYDVRGNVVSETRTEGGIVMSAVQYTWDAADRLSVEITATGKLLTTQRDTDGRIQQLSTAVGANPQIALVANIQTDAAGNTRAQSFGNGVTEARSYAEDGQAVNAAVTEPAAGGGEIGSDGDVPTLPEWGMIVLGALLLGIGYRKQGGGGTGWPGSLAGLLAVVLLLPLLAASPAVRANETLSYDANGNVQTRTLSGGTTTYGYDALDRVISEAGPAKTQSLTYDPN